MLDKLNRKIKISQKELLSIFYELNIMLQANLVLTDAFDILIKNRKDKRLKEFINDLKYSMLNWEKNSHIFIDKYEVNHFLISFLYLSYKKGNTKLNILSLYNLLKEFYELKKRFKASLEYPILLFITLFISLNSIFYFVIPKFKVLFSNSLDALPVASKLLFTLHDLYINYFIHMTLFFILISSLFYFYIRNNNEVRYIFDEFLIRRLYFIKDIYLNIQLYKFFLVLDIMIKSKYEIDKAISSSKVLLKNQYLLDRITLIENLLKNGSSITQAFTQASIFDDLVLNLINTAQKSNSLDIIIGEIKTIYKNRFNEKIKVLTLYIEPIFLVIIVSVVLWIVLAIFIPIWDMGNMLKI